MKPIVKILSLLSVISLTLVPISCDEMDIYTGPWQEVPTPGGEGHLYSCYFLSPNDGWACGSYGGVDDPDKLILMHWDGNSWTEYDYPGWFDDEGDFIGIPLYDIAFSSPDDGWCTGAVFYKYTGEDRSFGFILRYDGNNWYVFIEHLEETVGPIFIITENDIWFVVHGVEGSSGGDLYHWNGSELEFVNLYPGNYGISDIAFGSTNEGLAVGYYKFVYHWDGVSWDLITYDFGGEYSCVAYDTPTTAFIGGDNLARWEDGEYHRDYDYNGTYNGLHFSHPDEGWMHGGEPTEENPQGEGFFWHWDGVEWERSKAPDFMNPKAVFSVNYDDAWMVGMGWNASCQSWRYVID